MSVCCFFGHRKLYTDISNKIEKVIKDLILKNNVKMFYVGCNGDFDISVIKILADMSKKYNIDYNIVLAYLPQKPEKEYPYDLSNSIYPEGIESTPKRFAISWRNKWMIDKSDYVISYITHTYGGAYKYTELAKRKGKVIINLTDTL